MRTLSLVSARTGFQRAAAWLIILPLLAPPPAAAQYFGQNKVRYSQLDFSVLKTTHFDIYHYGRDTQSVDQAARMAERWYERLSTVLGHQLRSRQPLVLYANHPDFEQTTVVSGFIGPTTGGVTEGLQNRMAMPFAGTLEDTSHVLGHELVHAFQFDMGARGTFQLPLWFVEGMAEYLSLGPVDAHTALWLRDGLVHENLPGFDDLDDPDYFPYRFGHAAWAYLTGRWGDDIVPTLFIAASQNGDALSAIEAVTGVPLDELSRDWHAAIARTYRGVGEGLQAVGTPIVSEDENGGELNIGPSLSPDGRLLAFFSERELFSVELYIADARTGEVQRRVTDVATDPHFSNLQFLESTGAWAPDSRRFAFAAVRGATPALAIVDATTGGREREIELPALGEILNLAWSPDGSRIAISGLHQGRSDLFVYDLSRNALQQITDDLYAQLQPAWSPDGRTLAIVTDEFTSELDVLAFGALRIAMLDVATNRITPFAGVPDGKNINPQWSADGGTLYFIASPNGVPNVYRAPVGGGAAHAVTSLTTGVTGITAVTPALAVARETGDLVYTAFAEGRYRIYALPASRIARVDTPDVSAAALPPAQRRRTQIAGLLQQPRAGLPLEGPLERVAYDPNLRLTYVGASAATAIGTSQFGSLVAGGVTFLFSDVLNYHQVAATIEASGQAEDVAAQFGYLNQRTRWNWGGTVQRVPFTTGRVSSATGQIDGVPVAADRIELFRQIDRDVRGVVQYPFSRAARIEFGAGLRSIAFEREVTTELVSRATGQVLQRETQSLSAPDDLFFGLGSAAFVYDTAIMGGTGPLRGARSRVEISPTFGTLTFTEMLADVRRYVVPFRPVTLAGRLLHVGRFGGDSADERLGPLFVGFPNLVRGYDVNSFSASECGGAGSGCPVLDNLLGTRLLVGNAEVRVPLIGLFRGGSFDNGPLPIEGFVFGDTGIAWTDDEGPAFFDGSRSFVSSVGGGVRVNALGYAVLEFNGVRALDRPNRDWAFVFNLRPGF